MTENESPDLTPWLAVSDELRALIGSYGMAVSSGDSTRINGARERLNNAVGTLEWRLRRPDTSPTVLWIGVTIGVPVGVLLSYVFWLAR